MTVASDASVGFPQELWAIALRLIEKCFTCIAKRTDRLAGQDLFTESDVVRFKAAVTAAKQEVESWKNCSR